MKFGLRQCLVHAGLIGTERATTLEDERDALERRTRPRMPSPITGCRGEPPRVAPSGSRAPAIVRGGRADRRR
jgi:hypothetical protein